MFSRISELFRLNNLLWLLWWLVWAVFEAVIFHRLGFDWEFSSWFAGVSQGLMLVFTLFIVNFYKNYASSSFNFITRLSYSIVIALGMIQVREWLMPLYTIKSELFLAELKPFNLVFFAFDLLMILLVSLMFWLRFYFKDQEEQQSRKTEVEHLAKESELMRIRQQMQPHFLFNSLNSISALAGSNPQKARLMIQQLSDFLRGTLKSDENQLVTLKEELEHLNLYFEIEKVRFGHRLTTQVSVSEEAYNHPIPALLLQPVLENAIKYGLYGTIGEVCIFLNAEIEDGSLNITIQNPHDPESKSAKVGTGFGLLSVQRRLYLLYGMQDLLSVEETPEQFITQIKIPKTT